MDRFGDASGACNNDDGSSLFASQNNIVRSLEEVPFPRLNLPLTKSPELIKEIESILGKYYNSTPPENPKNHEKLKAMNFPISNITIGEWTLDAVYPDDLKAKFYFAKKKLMWESLDYVETPTTKKARLKRKIEIQWADVLSLEALYHPHDETGILKVELSKRPTFFMETNPQPGKHTQWQQMDQDFTFNHSASKCRRHTLRFAPGVLQKNLEKLVSGDSFWSELVKVRFPTLENPDFDIEYGNSNNNNGINSSHCSHGQILSFDVNNDLHHHSQGVRPVRMGEVNFDMETQFNGGMQINPYVQGNSYNNTMNQSLGTQVIQPSSQLNTEHDNMIVGCPMSQFYNSIHQHMSQMTNTNTYGHALLETQTKPMMSQHLNEPSMYPQVGPYEDYFAQGGERQNMEHTHFDGNFQINGNQQPDFDQIADYYYDPHMSSNYNGSVFPDMDIEDDFNGEGL